VNHHTPRAFYIFRLKDTSLQTRGIKIQKKEKETREPKRKADAEFCEPTHTNDEKKPEMIKASWKGGYLWTRCVGRKFPTIRDGLF
jgi:hypothetical protein